MNSPANNSKVEGWGLENNAGSSLFKGGGAWKTMGKAARESNPEMNLEIPT